MSEGSKMEQYRVQPKSLVDLNAWDPNDKSAFAGDKKAGREALKALNKRLAALQELLYAEHKHKVLIVLQAMDTGGKDGTIRRVFEGVNPQGVRVANFRAPTPVELDHDFLWRVHQQVPGRGELVVFNRSHYEDVLVVRVHDWVPPSVWRRRYAYINAFEQMLADEGTTILKFFLHIDREEQKRRLQARLDDPDKRWKFNPQDLQERKCWDDYMSAYAEALGQTSTDWASWYIVPANRKWYRDWTVATVVTQTLESLEMRLPQPVEDPDKIKIN